MNSIKPHRVTDTSQEMKEPTQIIKTIALSKLKEAFFTTPINEIRIESIVAYRPDITGRD